MTHLHKAPDKDSTGSEKMKSDSSTLKIKCEQLKNRDVRRGYQIFKKHLEKDSEVLPVCLQKTKNIHQGEHNAA